MLDACVCALWFLVVVVHTLVFFKVVTFVVCSVCFLSYYNRNKIESYVDKNS